MPGAQRGGEGRARAKTAGVEGRSKLLPHLEIPDLEVALHRPQAEPARVERGGVAEGEDKFVVASVFGDAAPCDEAEVLVVVGTQEEARRGQILLRTQRTGVGTVVAAEPCGRVVIPSVAHVVSLQAVVVS